jgi:hypothetical protein
MHVAVVDHAIKDGVGRQGLCSYERGRDFEIINNDSGITSAILDRLLYRAETVPIEGRSYRAKDRGEAQG